MTQFFHMPETYGQNALSPRSGNQGSFTGAFFNALTQYAPRQQNALAGQVGDLGTPSQVTPFGERLAASESGGNYGARNEFGYSGKYQFGQARLDDFNRAYGADFSTNDLMQSPELQERVFDWHIADIDRAIDANDLTRYGYSRDALRSVAHLGGVNGMIRFATTGGGYNPSDAFGTSLSEYADRHG